MASKMSVLNASAVVIAVAVIGRRVDCYISWVWELFITYSYTVCNSASDADVLCQRQDSDTRHQVYRSYWYVLPQTYAYIS